VESLIEKYDDRADWWDQWAETRQRTDDADRAYREEERERARDEDGEGDEGPREAPPVRQSPPPPARQYDPSKMQGGITDPQINFLRVLMRGMTPAIWDAVGAPKITGLHEPPRGPAEVRGLSKSQASRLIDVLKHGSPRYASVTDEVVVDGDLDGDLDSRFF